MRAPLQRELQFGEALAIAGAAASHADHAFAVWAARATGLAEQFLIEETELPEHFQVMQVRAYAERRGLPSPPNVRAWGHILRRLQKKGVIASVGAAPSAEARRHGVLTEWRSL